MDCSISIFLLFVCLFIVYCVHFIVFLSFLHCLFYLVSKSTHFLFSILFHGFIYLFLFYFIIFLLFFFVVGSGSHQGRHTEMV